MNDIEIETILRRVPAPKASRNLEGKLIAAIHLERAAASPRRLMTGSASKRWLPILSYGGLAAACLAVTSWQATELAIVRRENEALRTKGQDLDALRAANAEVQTLRNANAALNRLRQDNNDIPRLRSEIERLRAQMAELPQLRVDNQRLRAAAVAIPGALPDPFGEAKEKAERVGCVNNLKQLGLGARIWANDHHGRIPPDFISMTNELGSWRVFQDPGDNVRQITNWDQVAAEETDYQIDATGLTVNDKPNIVLYECPRHRAVCLLDGSVQLLSESALTNSIVVDADGRKEFVPDQRR
jgi:hypothetical protein